MVALRKGLQINASIVASGQCKLDLTLENTYISFS